mgnify:CR=1 FL=1
MSLLNLNCPDSITRKIEATREELRLMARDIWPSIWLVPEKCRPNYLETMRSQERYLVDRLNTLNSEEG